nr:MAG TPA: hypothetical protein [Caudoviricetes sp.]
MRLEHKTYISLLYWRVVQNFAKPLQIDFYSLLYLLFISWLLIFVLQN